MKICSLSLSIGKALQRMGHEVLLLDQYKLPRVLDIAAELDRRGFVPELLFQEELLGARVLLQNLKELDCPKVYWSVDTHLNLFWHEWYARLFDGVATPHVSILESGNCIGRPVLRLARFARECPWKPYAERSKDAAFVGRITEHRPRRKWLAEFIQARYDAAVAQDVSLAELYALYGDAKLAPNESILEEVNFRLVEAAACGCLVLSQPVGADQDALFEPGREYLVYRDVLELQSLMDHYAARPAAAEKLGRAAWERVRKEHLVEHRARSLLDFAATLTARAAKGMEAETAFGMVLWKLYRGGRVDATPQRLNRYLEHLSPSPERLLALMGLHVFEGRMEQARALARQTIAGRQWEDDVQVNTACSAVGLLADDQDLARLFWYRHCKAYGLQPKQPDTGCGLMLLWAEELRRQCRVIRHGEEIQAKRHLPETAYECLVLAEQLDQGGPGGREALAAMEELLATDRRLDPYRRDVLACLHGLSPEDWRLALALSGLELRSYRLAQGVEKAILARDLARLQNRLRSFHAALRPMDNAGLLARALQAAD